MKRIFYLFVGLWLLAGSPALADIQDRINNCERSGERSCIFNLLREIATQQSGGGGANKQYEVYLSGIFSCNDNEKTVTRLTVFPERIKTMQNCLFTMSKVDTIVNDRRMAQGLSFNAVGESPGNCSLFWTRNGSAARLKDFSKEVCEAFMTKAFP